MTFPIIGSDGGNRRFHSKITFPTKKSTRVGNTLPETNVAPENRPSQKETSLPNHPFSRSMLVSGGVLNKNNTKKFLSKGWFQSFHLGPS